AFGREVSEAFNFFNLQLVELRRDASSEQWIDHGKPNNTSRVVVGPASSTSIMHSYTGPDSHEDHYVFVNTDMSYDYAAGALNRPEVYDRHSIDGETWTWESLGSPSGRSTYGAPVVSAYSTGVPAAGGQGRLNTFVTAYNADSRRFELYHRYHDGTRWGVWENDGRPGDIGDQKFEMTSTVT